MKTPMRGFTLLELMVVLVIASVLLGIGIPAMGNFFRNARMTAAANDLLAAMYLARSEAIKRRSPVVVCASNNPLDADADCVTSGGTERLVNSANGWIVFVDGDADGRRAAGEQLLQAHEPLAATIVGRSSNSPLRLSYLDSGFSGTFTDTDGDGKRDPVDEVDLDGDGTWDPADPGEDIDGDGNQDVAEPLIRMPAFNLVLCDGRGNKASGGELSAARGIFVSPTGRPAITRDPTEIAALKAANAGGAIAGCS
jgi:type IV fimbrial biogenesis protein FimT